MGANADADTHALSPSNEDPVCGAGDTNVKERVSYPKQAGGLPTVEFSLQFFPQQQRRRLWFPP